MNIFLHCKNNAVRAIILPMAITMLCATPHESHGSPTLTKEITALSQLKKSVTLNFKNVPILEILKEIQRQTKIGYGFSENCSPAQMGTFSISATNVTVEQVLKTLFGNSRWQWEIADNKIVIDRQKTAPKTTNDKGKITLNGTIVDQAGQPVIGASIIFEGTSQGTTSDQLGHFSVSVAKGTALRITYVGMKSQRILIDGTRSDLRIVLVADALNFDQVIVTGYGNKSKNSYTGSSIEIKKEQLLSVGTKNVLQSLSSFVPGFRIAENINMGSDPNTLPDIMVRGRGSFSNANLMPTFIVDGVEVDVNYIYDMDINDVENATVMKDASATALYGSRAANGVIYITTRRINNGKIRVNYSGTVKVNVPDLSDYDLLNAGEKLEFERLVGVYKTDKNSSYQYYQDSLYNDRLMRVKDGVNTDWMSKSVRNSVTHNHNVSVEGGDEYIRYSLGLRYGNEVGIMKGSGRERIGTSFKLHYQKSDKIFFQNQFSILSVSKEDTPYGSFSNYVDQNPYDLPYDAEGNLLKTLSYNKANPLYEATLGSYSRGEEYSFNDVLSLDMRLFPKLKMYSSFSITKSKNDTEKFLSPLSESFSDDVISDRGSMSISNSKSFSYEGKIYFTYNERFANNSLLQIIGGGNIRSSSSTSNGYTAIGIASDKLDHMSFATKYANGASPSGSSSDSRSAGFFLTANFMIEDRYFIDGSFRYEGESRFGKNSRFAPFFSVGAGWNIHKEKFMEDANLDLLKLRASIGYVGNASFDATQALTTYRYSSDLDYGKGLGANPITIGNPDLKWERTLNYNIGIDFSMLKSRLDLTVDYYKKITDNLLLDVAKAPSIGITTARQNIGKIDNTGIEVNLSGAIIQNNDWMWRLGVIASHNQNKIRKISNALKMLNEKNNATNSTSPQPVYIEGESTSAVKAVQSGGIDPSTGREVYIKLDGTPTFVYDYNDKRVYGDSDPTVYGSINSTLNYRGFSLSMAFSYDLGATIYNSTLVSRVEGASYSKNADRRVFTSRWKQAGDIARFKNIADTETPYQTSRFIDDEYRFKMTSITLGYNFDKKLLQRIGLKQLYVSLLTNDIFNFSNIKQERGLTYPFSRSFEFSLRTNF